MLLIFVLVDLSYGKYPVCVGVGIVVESGMLKIHNNEGKAWHIWKNPTLGPFYNSISLDGEILVGKVLSPLPIHYNATLYLKTEQGS